MDHSCIQRLQLVQSAAARLFTGMRKRDRITPVLRSLHWFPVQFRVDFKIFLLAFKTVTGLAPSYLTELLHAHVPARKLCSNHQLLLKVPRTRLKTRGDRAFGIAASKSWNSLSPQVRFAPTLALFRSLLKIHLFSLAFGSD